MFDLKGMDFICHDCELEYYVEWKDDDVDGSMCTCPRCGSASIDVVGEDD